MGEGAAGDAPDDQGRAPEAAEQPIGGEQGEDQHQGEGEAGQRRHRSGRNQQAQDGRGEGEGDQQQYRRHHPGGEQPLQGAEEPAGAEQGQQQAAGQDGAVDRRQGETLAGDGADQQDRGRSGDQGKTVPPQHLAEEGEGDDKTGLLQKEDLVGVGGELEDADHPADDQDAGKGDGQPLEGEKERLAPGGALIQAIAKIHLLLLSEPADGKRFPAAGMSFALFGQSLLPQVLLELPEDLPQRFVPPLRQGRRRPFLQRDLPPVALPQQRLGPGGLLPLKRELHGQHRLGRDPRAEIAVQFGDRPGEIVVRFFRPGLAQHFPEQPGSAQPADHRLLEQGCRVDQKFAVVVGLVRQFAGPVDEVLAHEGRGDADPFHPEDTGRGGGGLLRRGDVEDERLLLRILPFEVDAAGQRRAIPSGRRR